MVICKRLNKKNMGLFSTRIARHLNEWLGKITGPPSLKVSKTQWDISF